MAVSSLSLVPIKLSSNDKDKLETLTKDLTKFEWEKGEYFFHNFVDYYQLPQIVRVEQNWNTNFVKGQWLYLQALFDRYLIIASPLSTSKSKSNKQKYLIPDWFQGECRILSKNPVLKKRWWVFQGAFELYRFDLPRDIKILADTPAHIRPKTNASSTEWDKIVLRKNGRLSVVRRESYQSRVKSDKGELLISEPKEAFILLDPSTGNEFIVPPGVPLRFATLIEDKELHEQYRSHEGTFTFPEIMMRYDFPLDVEITTHLPVDLPGFKSQVKLEKFCVAKSVLAYVLDGDQSQIAELSPLTQFTLHCAKCLTFGLPREGSGGSKSKGKEEKFDEKEYQIYENIRSQMNMIFDDAAELNKSKIQLGSSDEIECIETAYEISMTLKNEDDRPVQNSYLSLDEAIKVAKQPSKDEIPFPKTHPKRFTVHVCADPSNPYNEVIDYEDMDALHQTSDENGAGKSSKKDGPTAKSSSKSSSKDKKPQQPTNKSGKRPALVVQQLPPPMLLPPESFEKTLKAIPEKLYTDFLPATVSKKSDKTTASGETKSKEKTSRDQKKSRK